MKRINVPRLVWISSIFIFLIIVLAIIVDYKVNYQYLKVSTLYFYDCDNNLCVSETTDSDKIYSTFSCGKTACPVYERVIEEDYAILNYGESSVLYDYKNGKTISKSYDDYEFINNKYIIVTKKKNKGVINTKDEVTVKLVYEEIGQKNSDDDYITGYNNNSIIAKRNGKYGIISYKDGSIIEEFKNNENQINDLLNKIKKEDEVSV